MMKSARPGVCAVAVWSALSLGAAARAAPKAPAPPAPECDAICELGSYLARDHMVTLEPSAAPEVPAPKMPAARSATAKAAPKAADAKATPSLRRAVALTRRSPVRTVAPAPVIADSAPAPRRGSAAEASIIPGSAPLVTSQFEPQR